MVTWFRGLETSERIQVVGLLLTAATLAFTVYWRLR